MAASSHADGRDDDENQLDSIETGTTKAIGEVAKENLSNDGTQKGKEVDEEASPFSSVRPVYKCNRSKDDVGREEVVSVG